MTLTYEGLKTAPWEVYSESVSIDLGNMPETSTITVWVQVEDSKGTYSVPIGGEAPVFDMVAVTGGSSDSIPNGTQNGTWAVSDFSIAKTLTTQEQ